MCQDLKFNAPPYASLIKIGPTKFHDNKYNYYSLLLLGIR